MSLQRSGEATSHVPEVILNNFNTRLGRTFARMFASLFPHDPQFRGRRVVTFHNQRDFVFFRQHRSVTSAASKAGKLVRKTWVFLKTLKPQKSSFRFSRFLCLLRNLLYIIFLLGTLCYVPEISVILMTDRLMTDQHPFPGEL